MVNGRSACSFAIISADSDPNSANLFLRRSSSSLTQAAKGSFSSAFVSGTFGNPLFHSVFPKRGSAYLRNSSAICMEPTHIAGNPSMVSEAPGVTCSRRTIFVSSHFSVVSYASNRSDAAADSRARVPSLPHLPSAKTSSPFPA